MGHGLTIPRRQFFGGAMALGAAACNRAGSRNVLWTVDAQPPGYPTVIGLEAMADELLRLSDGRLRMKIYAGGQLGAEKDTLEITIFGGLDINRINMAPLNSIVPETLIPSLPFMFRSTAHMRAAMDGAPGRAILNALAPHGLIGLCFYDSGARSFYTSSRLIETPDDLKGLKIRVQNSDLYVSMVKALGGDATPMVFAEVYQGLMQRVVDGAENNWPSYESTRHFEPAPYYSLTRHVMAPEALVMSAKSWARLTEDDKALVRRAAAASVPAMRRAWDERVERSKGIVLAPENEVQVITPETAPFQALMAPVWDKYLSTPPLRRLAEDIQNVTAAEESP